MMSFRSTRRARAARRLLTVGTLSALAALSLAVTASAKTSATVGYITDFGLGANDPTGPPSIPGSSIFVNALTGSVPGGSYTTGDSSKTVSITDVTVSTIDASGVTALEPFDTVILYQVCDIASHPKTMAAINAFLTDGGKVMIFDADRCAEGEAGRAHYNEFLFPFETSSPGPRGASGEYKTVVSSSLTEGLAVGPQEGDSVGDANIFTAFEGPWCASIDAKNVLGAEGFVEATAQTPNGGLVIYEGEDFWFTFGHTPHLRLVFDDMLKQNWAPAGLPCTIPASGIVLTPPTQTHEGGATATVTAKVTNIEGAPVEGQEVAFEVVSGPNAGKSGTGKTDSAGEVPFSYVGSSTPGTDKVVASFIDSLSHKHTSEPVEVIWEDQKISAAGEKLSGTEGLPTSGTVATFTDPDTSAVAGDYEATIEWGDGSTSTGTITGSAGSFNVSGEHTYAEEGLYPTKVIITDVDTPSNNQTVTGAATIGDAPLSATGVSAVSPMSFSGTVAHLTDVNTLGSASDFTATIDWGDSSTSTGTVTGGGGTYTVSGSHTYSSTGFFTVTVKIVDDGGSTAEAKSTILIFATTSGGNFVIGDKDAALETPVEFWGAQWWKLNELSGGSAPASFKGFANTPSTAPACGTKWSTDPGNSSGPPAAPLPEYIAVIVSSHITKSGPTISGNTPEVVVVKTNGGYAPNPGHAGTGTVVGVVCKSTTPE
jgi:hypothetical protein